MAERISHRPGGFTVIEVLLAMTIFLLITGGLASVFIGGMRVSRLAQEKGDRLRARILLIEKLSSDLETAFPSWAEEGGLVFEGQADALSFVTVSGSRLWKVRYFFEIPQEGQVHEVRIGEHRQEQTAVTADFRETELARRLVRDITPLREGDPGAKRDILCRGGLLEDFKFSFIGKRSGAAWQDAWSGPGLPAGVAVETESFRRVILIPRGLWPPEDSR
ncbi:MAG: type II secretion system protein [Candidatus Omnitrophota bacterium]|nr:type II secretion system protein [Candidatus Omnitrophota bacterium]MDZ4241366.1 type II secretion system protein [Candidatus Omnitrophota bacterium]